MKIALGLLATGWVTVLVGCADQPAHVQNFTANVQATSPGPAVTPTGSSASPSGPQKDSPGDRIVARVDGQPITMQEFLSPLIESHGLQILMGLVQLNLAKQDARESHIVVSPEDIAHEREVTLQKMFKDADVKEQDQLDLAESRGDADKVDRLRAQIRSDRETLLAQYLDNQHFSPTEFNLKIEINAYLRKAAERGLRGRVTDDMVEKEFGVEYGETAEVRYIQLANMQEVAEARQRLKNGEDFGDIAESMSHNARTAAAKGLMPTFSRQTPGLPDTFKQAAFDLQKGQVSDTLSLGGNFFIIKLEQKFAPKAVKFENVKESLRRSMYDRLTELAMEEIGTKLGQRAVDKLDVEDPLLKKVYDKFKADHQAALTDRQKLDDQWRREREALAAATQPAAAPATMPAATSVGAPATQP